MLAVLYAVLGRRSIWCHICRFENLIESGVLSCTLHRSSVGHAVVGITFPTESVQASSCRARLLSEHAW
jgi:hypothetical protein